MTNLNDTRTAAPTIALLRNRFAPWQMLCREADETADDESEAPQADENDVDSFDAEDPRDIFVRDRLARLEAFSAA